jgi:hypothetical protein
VSPDVPADLVKSSQREIGRLDNDSYTFFTFTFHEFPFLILKGTIRNSLLRNGLYSRGRVPSSGFSDWSDRRGPTKLLGRERSVGLFQVDHFATPY